MKNQAIAISLLLIASQQEIGKKIKGTKRNTAVDKQTARITATEYIRVGLSALNLIYPAYEQYLDTFTQGRVELYTKKS